MTLRDVYAASVIALFVLVAVTVLVAIRQRSFGGFTTADLRLSRC